MLPISYAFIAMLGADGLRESGQSAVLAANYIASRLDGHYPILYTGAHGLVAHESELLSLNASLPEPLEIVYPQGNWSLRIDTPGGANLCSNKAGQ